ncbi:hypothetical protein [Flexithrix dorotheae]|uniref:hypothetical protein n=1 Tax=Flexithrix dorotheae TaxID=70993 RepID=UPI00037FFB46|nr:hypothetical protein [Flexithrix dorotheae]
MEPLIYTKDIFSQTKEWRILLEEVKEKLIAELIELSEILDNDGISQHVFYKLYGLQNQLVGLNMSIDKLLVELRNWNELLEEYPEDYLFTKSNNFFKHYLITSKSIRKILIKHKDLMTACYNEKFSFDLSA